METKPNVNRYVEQETGTYSPFNLRAVAGLQRFVRALHGKLSRTASRLPLNNSCSHSHFKFDTYSWLVSLQNVENGILSILLAKT